jgi:hypothetical protein
VSEEGGQGGGNPVGQFFGVLLIAVGALIATLCGLCTLVFIGTSFAGAGSDRAAALSGIPIFLLIGGTPTAFGAILIWLGILMVRRGRRRPPKVKLDTFD